ncbi:relation to actin related 2 3 (Arp2 3) complex subunit 4 [Cryptosporidium sp. chipmunk genotype I]|uniref:relation to actin related 2 3 (Arp2 3) complex subunit 4 n=1 Tax=Cryptosporidium sp. chipmunk genotype I TaxID=1280935 RepID=UPI00351A814A|nr:relation to actin related 2 3 (Arp2 3) complex subunit 4 [Cryptosporidium sp. chipmunk genotype I]
MQSKKIELQDTDSNAPLLPYLRRLFNTLNKEICLFYLPLNLPCMFSVPFIEQEHLIKNLSSTDYDDVSDSKKSFFNRDNKVELIKSLYVYRHSKEFCYIESCIDSVRVSLKFYFKCEFEKRLFNQLTIFMKKNSDYLQLVRKKSIEGFDISFLITNHTLNSYNKICISNNNVNKQMGKYDVIHFILKFVVDIDRQIQDKMLQSTYFSRYYIRKLLQEFNVNVLYKQSSTNISKQTKQKINETNKSEVKLIESRKAEMSISEQNNNLLETNKNLTLRNINSVNVATQLNDSIGRDAIVLKALKTRNRIKNLIN